MEWIGREKKLHTLTRSSIARNAHNTELAMVRILVNTWHGYRYNETYEELIREKKDAIYFDTLLEYNIIIQTSELR